MFKLYLKMEKAIIKLDDIEIEKQEPHQHKRPFSIQNIDTNQIAVSKKTSFGSEHFIGYKDTKQIRPLCIFLPKINACRRDFDETKYMWFFIKDDEL